MAAQDVTIERLEDQINWYDQRSAYCQQRFKVFKVATIFAGALVPLCAKSAFLYAPELTGALGIVIVLSEGFQQMNQYHQNWIGYRSTAEALKHEKFLYLAKAGPYASANDPHALLAERVESLVSQEHAKWASSAEQSSKKPPSGG